MKKVVVHDARMHTDMIRQFMNHNEFEFDRVFDESADNDTVYACAARPLVDIAVKGGFSTCMVYGQTGSGKTFTMKSIYDSAARDVFAQLERATQRFSPTPPSVSVSFFEVAGDSCSDLLNEFRPLQLLTAHDGGSVHAFPLVEVAVSSREELAAMIQMGLGVRSTAATGVHDASSRSHALLLLHVQRPDLTPEGEELLEGSLTLVDLAGSEHRIDSM